mmetsp:Transcript_35390/g.89167  ORF Transcript_35390/g.89167 Transcript_35390/m.89167 type:complete len:562 (-) Transcript_35390:136-1821(-)
MDTPPHEVPAIVQRVANKAAEWAALPAARKQSLLEECLRLLEVHRLEMTHAACTSRGYQIGNKAQGHLVADAVTLSCATNAAWLRGSIEFLRALSRDGKPPSARQIIPRPDGTSRARFSPNLKEWLLRDGCSLELVVRGDLQQGNPLELAPSVSGVLGAGNTEILNDILDPLCRLNSVVVYKSNPVLSVSNRVKEQILAPLIGQGYVAFVYGGADQGRIVAESPAVSRVLLTGSHQTFDKIMWGSQSKHDASAKPLLSKPVHAELGSVNPYIIVPGISRWSVGAIRAQAEAFVAYKLVNNAHVCAAPQVLVTCRRWSQRREFLDAVRQKLADAPPARCFYPGISKQYKAHIDAMGEKAWFCHPRDDEQLVPALQEDLQASGGEAGAVAFGLREEAFCPILYEVTLDCEPETGAFLRAAVDFCHQDCAGNLTCAIVMDDATRAKHQQLLDRTIDAMRFGIIGVNVPPSVANVFPFLTWGAFPGNDPRDIQSGVGYVGNFCCYEGIEKTILVNRFRNAHQFKLATSIRDKARAKKRADRLAAALAHTSLWRLTKLALVEYIGV